MAPSVKVDSAEAGSIVSFRVRQENRGSRSFSRRLLTSECMSALGLLIATFAVVADGAEDGAGGVALRELRSLQEMPAMNGTVIVVDQNGTNATAVNYGMNSTANDVTLNTTANDLMPNGTRRYLQGGELELIFPSAFDRLTTSPCHQVDVTLGDDPKVVATCQDFLREPYISKDCSAGGRPEIVPRVYHSVSKDSTQSVHQLAITTLNPSYQRHHLGDEEAADFVRDHCGAEAYEAYECLVPSTYRSDLFRFCALVTMGGVYLDQDIVPFVPLEELYSPCSTATVGLDFPHDGIQGKQMKILAASPGAPIFQCALDRIVENVKHRAYPETERLLTGPQLLHQCYEAHFPDVAVTYRDTRNAAWPFTGMRQGSRILAYELPLSPKQFSDNSNGGGGGGGDTDFLFRARQVYSETCEL